jgi:hypothetical protein
MIQQYKLIKLNIIINIFIILLHKKLFILRLKNSNNLLVKNHLFRKIKKIIKILKLKYE